MSTEKHGIAEEELDDWASFSQGFGHWWSRHGTRTLSYILIALAVVFLVQYWSGRADRQREEAYWRMETTISPVGLRELADRYRGIPGYAGAALLQAGDLRLREALETIPGATDVVLSAEDRTAALGDAAGYYQQVIDLNQSALQVLAARFGLASVDESRGAFDAARKQYDEIQTLAAKDWPHQAKIAQKMAGELDRIAKPVSFPDPPKPEPTAQVPDTDGTPALLKRPDDAPAPAVPAVEAPTEAAKPEAAPSKPAADEPAPKSEPAP